MTQISQVDIHQVKEWVDAQSAAILDIRDPMAFSMGHIPTARHVSDANVQETLDSLDKNQTVVVCCYHGISSQGAAGYLMQNGFTDVHSMAGGFEAWSQAYPAEQDNAADNV